MYRLAMKTILDKALAHKSPLLPSQLGVKSKGSVEPIARGVERAKEHSSGLWTRITLTWSLSTPVTLSTPFPVPLSPT